MATVATMYSYCGSHCVCMHVLSQLAKAGFSAIVCTTYDCFTLGLSVASSYYTRSQENKVTSSVEHAHTQLCWSLENSKKIICRQTLLALIIIMEMRKVSNSYPHKL